MMLIVGTLVASVMLAPGVRSKLDDVSISIMYQSSLIIHKLQTLVLDNKFSIN